MTNLFLKLNEDGFVCKELNHMIQGSSVNDVMLRMRVDLEANNND